MSWWDSIANYFSPNREYQQAYTEPIPEEDPVDKYLRRAKDVYLPAALDTAATVVGVPKDISNEVTGASARNLFGIDRPGPLAAEDVVPSTLFPTQEEGETLPSQLLKVAAPYLEEPHVNALARGISRPVSALATDPMAVGGMGGRVPNIIAGAYFGAHGAKGAGEELGTAASEFSGGDYKKAIEHGAGGLFNLGMAGLGAHSAVEGIRGGHGSVDGELSVDNPNSVRRSGGELIPDRPEHMEYDVPLEGLKEELPVEEPNPAGMPLFFHSGDQVLKEPKIGAGLHVNENRPVPELSRRGDTAVYEKTTPFKSPEVRDPGSHWDPPKLLSERGIFSGNEVSMIRKKIAAGEYPPGYEIFGESKLGKYDPENFGPSESNTEAQYGNDYDLNFAWTSYLLKQKGYDPALAYKNEYEIPHGSMDDAPKIKSAARKLAAERLGKSHYDVRDSEVTLPEWEKAGGSISHFVLDPRILGKGKEFNKTETFPDNYVLPREVSDAKPGAPVDELLEHMQIEEEPGGLAKSLPGMPEGEPYHGDPSDYLGVSPDDYKPLKQYLNSDPVKVFNTKTGKLVKNFNSEAEALDYLHQDGTGNLDYALPGEEGYNHAGETEGAYSGAEGRSKDSLAELSAHNDYYSNKAGEIGLDPGDTKLFKESMNTWLENQGEPPPPHIVDQMADWVKNTGKAVTLEEMKGQFPKPKDISSDSPVDIPGNIEDIMRKRNIPIDMNERGNQKPPSIKSERTAEKSPAINFLINKGTVPKHAIVAAERFENITKQAWDRIKNRAAAILNEPELRDLDIDLDWSRNGKTGGWYAGKRAMGVGGTELSRNRGKILIDPTAMLSDGREGFISYLRKVLTHEPAHVKGLHTTGTELEIPGGKTAEVPAEWSKEHTFENQTKRAGVGAEEARVEFAQNVLEHDPEIQTVLDQLGEAFKKDVNIYNGLVALDDSLTSSTAHYTENPSLGKATAAPEQTPNSEEALGKMLLEKGITGKIAKRADELVKDGYSIQKALRIAKAEANETGELPVIPERQEYPKSDKVTSVTKKPEQALPVETSNADSVEKDLLETGLMTKEELAPPTLPVKHGIDTLDAEVPPITPEQLEAGKKGPGRPPKGPKGPTKPPVSTGGNGKPPEPPSGPSGIESVKESDSFSEAWNRLSPTKKVEEIFNIHRALRSSGDTPIGRQGRIISFNNPIIAWRAAREMAKSTISKEYYNELNAKISSDPVFTKMSELGSDYVPDFAGITGGREEAFPTPLAEKIPVAGKYLIAPSDRAYTSFMNAAKLGYWKKHLARFEKAGITPESHPKDFKDLKRVVDLITFRGDVNSKIVKELAHSPTAGAALYSPRGQASKFQLLRQLFLPSNLTGRNSRLLRKNLIQTFAVNGAFYGALAYGGAGTIETDPESSDFLKFKMGEKRYNPWMGLNQVVRAAVLTNTGKYKAIGSGKERAISNEEVLGRFIRNSLAPTPGMLWSLYSGVNPAGQKVRDKDDNLEKKIFDTAMYMFTNEVGPMSAKDVVDAYKENADPGVTIDLKAIGKALGQVAIPGALGENVAVYEPKEEPVKKKKGKKKYHFPIY